MDAAGGNEVTVSSSQSDDYVLGWTSDGSGLVLASNRSGNYGAWHVPMKDGTSGGQTLIKRDVGSVVPLGVTRSGALHYGTHSSSIDLHLVTIDPATGKAAGEPKQIMAPSGSADVMPKWSANGKKLVFFRSILPQNQVRKIFIYSGEDGSIREVLPKVQFLGRPIIWLGPDTLGIFAKGADGRNGIYRVDANSGAAELIKPSESDRTQMAHVEGTPLIFLQTLSRSGVGKITAFNMRDKTEKEIYTAPSGDRMYPGLEVSYDARQVSFSTYRDTNASLMVVSSAGGEARAVHSGSRATLQGRNISWSGDGKYIYFSGREDATKPFDLWRVPAAGGGVQKAGVGFSVNFIAANPVNNSVAAGRGSGRLEVWAMENFVPRPAVARR